MAATGVVVVICGGPKTGKTHLCRNLGRQVIHTDEYMPSFTWVEGPWALISWVRGKDRWVMEGVQSARALRKGLEADAVIFLDGSVQELQPRQEGLRKSVDKWFGDWHAEHPDVPTFTSPVTTLPKTRLTASTDSRTNLNTINAGSSVRALERA